MAEQPSVFRLKIQQVNQSCLFELSWGKAQQLSAILTYPFSLDATYQEWRRAYLNFYQAIPGSQTEKTKPTERLRGRVEESGALTPPAIDWQAKLVQAEASLLYQFHHWLRSRELFEIRSAIAGAAGSRGESKLLKGSLPKVDVFLICSPLALARLPWESWEISPEFGTTRQIRLARFPVNVRTAAGVMRPRRSRVRVLAILGDETGLNFQVDRDALRQLAPIADVEFVGWQVRHSTADLKHQVCQAIASEQGWDVLFFAGHSNETQITGGEVAIAPGVALSIQEIVPQLITAKEQGLQCAIFNSCSGLCIANTLIDLGLSQVAVMREPIHNQVAQEFLLQFLQGIVEYRDLHDALIQACQRLELERSLTYPSAYLIPSLFRYPDTELFRLEPVGLKARLRPWLPIPREAIALSILLLLSLWPTLQDILLAKRIWTQAVYRDLTGQVPAATAPPPVLLVQVDPHSIQRSAMSRPNPIDRAYLARLVGGLTALDAKVISIDYLLDRQQPGQDKILARAVHSAVAQQGTWLVFAAITSPAGDEVGVYPGTGITRSEWSLQASINSLPTHIKLLSPGEDCRQTCPFAYLLSLVAAYRQEVPASTQLQPSLESRSDLRGQLLEALSSTNNPDGTVAFLSQLRFHLVTTWSRYLGQQWLRPILDLSIPPNQVYQRISAWQLLQSELPGLAANTDALQNSEQIAIIAPGGYDEAGVSQPDSFPIPEALQYWRTRGLVPSNVAGESSIALENLPVFTGAEAHAYAIHHLLGQHLVVPIPDAWMVIVAALLGKAAVLNLQRRAIESKLRFPLTLSLVGATGFYGVVGLQAYLSAAVLLPWLLPTATVWIYVLPSLWSKGRAST